MKHFRDRSSFTVQKRSTASLAVQRARARPKFPELESSLLTYFRRDVPRDLYESYNEAKHVVT
jgi:hypothetical protein